MMLDLIKKRMCHLSFFTATDVAIYPSILVSCHAIKCLERALLIIVYALNLHLIFSPSFE
jgi:hypothetical protein